VIYGFVAAGFYVTPVMFFLFINNLRNFGNDGFVYVIK